MQNPAAREPALPPALVLGAGILSASTSSIFVRFAQAGAPSLVIAAYRLLFATALLLPWLLVRYRPQLRAMGLRALLLSLLAGVFLTLHFATWITSLEFTTVASSVVLVQTAPLMVAALSPVLLKEPLSRALVLGLGVATLGVLVVGMSDACDWRAGLACPSLSDLMLGEAMKGDALAVAGAAGGAGYILIGRVVRRNVELVPYIATTYGSAAVMLTVLALIAGHSPTGYAPQAYLWMALLAVFPQLIGHTSYNWALRYLPAAMVSIALLGEPVASTGLAVALLDEIPSAARLIGATLILAGIAIAARSGDAVADIRRE